VSDTLFPSPRRRRGSTEVAAERVLARWRADGHDVDELTSSNLRGAAADVDRALRDHGSGDAGLFPVTRARALLHELYRFAVPDGVDPDDDELDLVDPDELDLTAE
jgi:hypothetical protein